MSIIWFLFYPFIVEVLAGSINCIEIDGFFRLYEHFEQKCYRDSHKFIMIFISIPGLLLWAIGVPLLGLYSLRRFLHEIDQSRFESQPDIPVALKQRYHLRLGFLTSGYKNQYYYWEIVLLLRKTIFVMMMVSWLLTAQVCRV